MSQFVQSLIAATLLVGASSMPAHAQVALTVTGGKDAIASYFQLGNCLDFNASNVSMHATCDGSDRQRFAFASGNYGEIRGSSGKCLTSGLAAGQPLSLQPCAQGRNQRWGFQPDGALRNEQGFCVDIEGGNRASGGRVVGWTCGGSTNQKWYQAKSGATARMTSIPSTMLTSITGRALVSSSNVSQSNIVAGGAGNIVAGGAGNIVAGGAGNIVAGGAGNIIAASIVAGGAGNIVAGGAGNLIANDGASMRSMTLPTAGNFASLKLAGFLK